VPTLEGHGSAHFPFGVGQPGYVLVNVVIKGLKQRDVFGFGTGKKPPRSISPSISRARCSARIGVSKVLLAGNGQPF
jgi:hypothetical protein